jgi:hypothetical protein
MALLNKIGTISGAKAVKACKVTSETFYSFLNTGAIEGAFFDPSAKVKRWRVPVDFKVDPSKLYSKEQLLVPSVVAMIRKIPSQHLKDPK